MTLFICFIAGLLPVGGIWLAVLEGRKARCKARDAHDRVRVLEMIKSPSSQGPQ
jgi:hypothetical protein